MFKHKTEITVERKTTTVGKPRNVRERIIFIRIDNKLDQSEMGNIAGISRTNYLTKESPDRVGNFSVDQVIAIGKKFKLNMNWLMLGEGEPYKAKEKL